MLRIILVCVAKVTLGINTEEQEVEDIISQRGD